MCTYTSTGRVEHGTRAGVSNKRTIWTKRKPVNARTLSTGPVRALRILCCSSRGRFVGQRGASDGTGPTRDDGARHFSARAPLAACYSTCRTDASVLWTSRCARFSFSSTEQRVIVVGKKLRVQIPVRLSRRTQLTCARRRRSWRPVEINRRRRNKC